MSSEQNLPAVGSVWGNPDDVASWCRFVGVDDDRGYHWETWRGEFFETELSRESAVDIRALVTSGGRPFNAERWNAELDQPFTVDWLVEIGAVVLREAGPYGAACIGWEDDVGWLLAFDSLFTWTFRGEAIGEKPITTRRDVLKWLDVLKIDVATKGSV